MSELQFQFKEISVSDVERDANQPRKDIENININRLTESLGKRGLQQPLIVRELGESEGRYRIIDGHRRFRSAQNLGLKTVPCIVYKSSLKDGELELIRYDVQNNRMAWKPMERAAAFHRIKTTNHLKSNKDVGNLVGLSDSSVSNYLKLREVSDNVRELMGEYKLTTSNRTEFMRLFQKLRKIRELETDQIMKILLEKKKNKVIRNAKDLRQLSKVFLRASVNEKEIYKFLTRAEMTIEELVSVTINTGNALLLDKIITLITQKLQHAQKLEEPEEKLLMQLGELIEKYNKLKPSKTA